MFIASLQTCLLLPFKLVYATFQICLLLSFKLVYCFLGEVLFSIFSVRHVSVPLTQHLVHLIVLTDSRLISVLYVVLAGPAVVDFGDVCPKSVSQKDISIINNLDQYIHFVANVSHFQNSHYPLSFPCPSGCKNRFKWI